MLLHHFLENSASRLARKVSLICDGERLTYGEINERANQVAHFLRELGTRRQDRVAVFLDNSVASVISIFGILKADAIFLVLNPTMKASKLAYVLNDCQIKVLITHTSRSQVSSDGIATAKSLKHVVWVGRTEEIPSTFGTCAESHSFAEVSSSGFNASVAPPSSNIDLDLASIIYTSGSTGEPKGIMLSHRNMVSAATSVSTYLENREDDIIIDFLPLSFDYGLYQVLMAFKFGGTVVLERAFTYPYKMILRMIEERVTGFPGVPTIFAILLGLKKLEKFDFSNLRYITNTAAALPPTHIEQLRGIFPHVRLYSMYGLTECKRVSYLPPAELDRRPGSIGRGMPNEEVWVEDDDGGRAPPGTVGELVVRGSNVMVGYWGRPDETARALRPGKYPGERVLHTGDLFKMDEEGFLYFIGRKDDMLKSRGEKISPKEVEHCLCALEGVAEAAVIGVPDEVLGQAIIAFIRCKDGQALTEKDVILHCKSQLEDFMVPKSVEFIETFPKTSSGKVDKLSLKSMICNH